jgi:hypothetical protein
MQQLGRLTDYSKVRDSDCDREQFIDRVLHFYLEDNLEEMKGVVRKKFGVSDSVPIFLSQIREGKLVDLEDGRLIVSLLNIMNIMKIIPL